MIKTKVCNKCKRELPLNSDHYNIRKDSKDGFKNTCKKCCTEYNREYRKKNETKFKEYQKTYRDNHVEERRQYNREYQSQYYENNKESINKRHVEYNRKYIKTKHGRELDRIKRHRKRAIDHLNGGEYTVEQWDECLKFFDNRCAYTGEKLKYKEITVDHITPLVSGGTSYIGNIVPSSKLANNSKSNNEMKSWFRKQSYFSEERLKKILDWIEYAEFIF